MLSAAHRPQGPAQRARVGDAVAWIDRWAAPLGPEDIALRSAAGRVVARTVEAALAVPPFDRAAVDGFALRADETVGASAYNPLPFRLQPASAGVAAGVAVAVQSGDPLPAGADAIVRLEHAVAEAAGTVAVIAPVFAGNEVEPAGSHAGRGSVLFGAGQRLGPGDIGLLASAGLERIAVVRRPRVRCLVPAGCAIDAGQGLQPGSLCDANGPLLTALVERDGGVVADLRRPARDRSALRDALRLPGADAVLVAGGTGPGAGDEAAAALQEAGEIALHGVAMRPGETAGAGRAADTPVFLLPGTPAACLWAYELLAGGAIRRLAGLGPELPFRTETLRTARKIVSEIGTLDVCPVRCTGHGAAEPIASFAEAGLASVARADGFVLVPEASEGYPEGAPVTVHLYPERRCTQP
jgi:molybdopterin molybdotransferase